MRSRTATFTDEQVIEFRRRVRLGEIAFTTLAREVNVRHKTMRLLVLGRTYADVPGALNPAEIPKYSRRKFTDEQVLFMRLIFRGGVSAQALARHYGVDPKAITEILKGRVYREVPERIEGDFMDRVHARRGLSDEDVLRIRRYYASRSVSMRMLALEYGITAKNMAEAIRGSSYKHLPLAVPAHIRFRNTAPLGNRRERQRIRRAKSRYTG